jgi:hypothetical protein
MPSLIDIPELVGFFSYSRDDDQGSRGALSALRDAIQTELSAQLGRTRTDFRLWQDKSAISLGTLWEKQISQGINQAVFFIPIITPRALRSQHCAYEFQAFLARESELGRDDLVFPILYIPVPALEDEKLWRDEPILRIVATRQYLDWRELRHHDPRSLEVQQKLEWYCRGITNALHKTWIPPISSNPLKRDEPEAAGTKLQVSADAPRRAEQNELAGKAETSQPVPRGTRPRASRATRSAREAEGIKLQLSADAPRPAEQDELAGKGETLQPVPEERSREQAAEQPVRHEPALAAAKPRVGALVGAAVALTLIGGGVAGWLALAPSANTQSRIAATAPTSMLPPLPDVETPDPIPSATSTNVTVAPTPPLAPNATSPGPAPASGPAPDEVAWALIQDINDAAAFRHFVAQFPDSVRRKDAEARLDSLVAAQAAWNSVRDSKDPDQLRQFVRQFPDSVQRNDAEARLDSLLAAQAAWNLVKDSKDPDQLRQFVRQFPDSWERPVAEQRIVSLDANLQKPAVVRPPDPHELTRSLQLELQRVGCFKGTVNGQFDDDTKTAWHRFMKLASIAMSDDLSTGTIDAVRGFTKRICPLDCPRGQHAEKETCVANAAPERDAKPRRSAKAPSVNRTTAAPVGRVAAPPPDRPLPSIPLSIGIGGGHGGFSIGIGP